MEIVKMMPKRAKTFRNGVPNLTLPSVDQHCNATKLRQDWHLPLSYLSAKDASSVVAGGV